MGKSLSKAGCASLLCLVVASFSSAANAWGYLQKAHEEPTVGLPVVNDGYLSVVNTFDSESITPKFCPPLSTFKPEDSNATPCEQYKLLTGKDADYPEMTAQDLLDMVYGRSKVQLVGVAPQKPGYSVLYWRYVAPVQPTPSAAAPRVGALSAISTAATKAKIAPAH